MGNIIFIIIFAELENINSETNTAESSVKTQENILEYTLYTEKLTFLFLKWTIWICSKITNFYYSFIYRTFLIDNYFFILLLHVF